MPTLLNPRTPAKWYPSLDTPADGELANAASVNDAFQRILDGVDNSRRANFGRRLQARYRIPFANSWVRPFTMVVEALGPIVLTTGGGSDWVVVHHGVSTSIDLETAAGGLLVAQSRYYVYAYLAAGVLSWIASLDPPDITLRYRLGNTDYAYVGTFFTGPPVLGVAQPWPQCSHGAWTNYTQQGFPVLAFGAAVAYTAFNPYSCSDGPCAPPYARTFNLNIFGSPGGGAADSLIIGNVGSGGGGVDFWCENGRNNPHHLLYSSDDGAALYYHWSVGGAGANAWVHLQGWLDPRG